MYISTSKKNKRGMKKRVFYTEDEWKTEQKKNKKQIIPDSQ